MIDKKNESDLSVNTTQIKVRPNDLDGYGHVNHSICLQYFELGRFEWLNENEISLKPTELLPVVTNASLGYLQQIYLSSKISVITELYAIKSFSVVMQQKIIDEDNKTLIKGLITIAFVDVKKKQPARVKNIFGKKQ
jgi:acyl-CoA thioester hydrolase